MEKERHILLWNACLRVFENILEPAAFTTWFKPIRPVGLEGSTLTVEVPSEFFREYLEEYYLGTISKVLKKEIGTDAKLIYMVRPVTNNRPMSYPSTPSAVPTNTTAISAAQFSGTAASPSPFVFPGVKKIHVNPQLNPTYCFANLVKGECNKMGVTAGESISSAPGNTPFNPLFIFGGPGLGKTHLAQAIGIAIKERFPEQIVLYVPANRFKTQYMNAVHVQNRLTDFLAFYMKMDVLIVDDIQELATAGTQNAFFHVFNHLHQNGKQLIFTSDRSPADLQNFEERLLSRLKWGLSVELRHPDYQTRLEMLRARAFREGVSLPDEVLEFLARRISTNFRELEGALISLIANATLAHREMTVELADEITRRIVGEQKNELSIERIEEVVSGYFNVPIEDLHSRCRRRDIVQARQIAMYMARNLMNCPLSKIGEKIGGKDHATVLHACTTVSDLMSTDRSFKRYIKEIEGMLVPVE